ncbi:MAG: Maf family protein [Bryobacteraceae bacterium]
MLILASASPRRRELLSAAGIDHRVRIPHVDETQLPGEEPVEYVQRLARAKASAIHSGEDDIILGADTVVCLQREVFGKPSDSGDAVRMLRRLSGRAHWVFTGVCLRSARREIVDVAGTEVFFDDLTDREIIDYVDTGEALDKAGAYAIQGLASKFVREIRGCYQNVVGLPVSRVYRHLQCLSDDQR